MSDTLFDKADDRIAPTITALAPWFGSNRMLAPTVGRELAGCRWVGVPFAGGMSEVAHIKASTIVVSDLHRHVINLAKVAQIDWLRIMMREEVNGMPFHPDVLRDAQERCQRGVDASLPVDYGAARDYFICCWMGRSAKAGTDDEFKGGLPVRWTASGGDSNTRYRSAIESLEAWGQTMRRCNFVVKDVFEFLDNAKDEVGVGLYLDPPFPGPGDAYKHKFTEAQHRQLAERLLQFKAARIVCRFYDHPLIREIYGDRWTWRFLDGRKQSNDKAPEVLLINGPSFS